MVKFLNYKKETLVNRMLGLIEKIDNADNKTITGRRTFLRNYRNKNNLQLNLRVKLDSYFRIHSLIQLKCQEMYLNTEFPNNIWEFRRRNHSQAALPSNVREWYKEEGMAVFNS